MVVPSNLFGVAFLEAAAVVLGSLGFLLREASLICSVICLVA